MRFKYTVVVLLIVIAGTATTSTGQEEPLPAIQVKGSVEPFSPPIVLAVEPLHQYATPTLAEAARANDYVTFDALYRAEPNAAFATLHELWTYSITDPIGAFYGREMFERFARAYAGYASYIEPYRIVDRNGNVFYPTSETRTFLLERAMEGRAPRVLLAEGNAATRTAAPRVERFAASTAQAPPTPRSVPRRAPAPAPAVVSTPAPVQAVPESAPVVATPLVEEPVVVRSEETAPAPVAATPAPVETQAAAPQTETQAPQPIAVENNPFGSRGILLLVIGLVGIGLLAMMLRTPREVQPTSILTPENHVTPPPVEPIRRPSAATPGPPAQQQAPEKNRASGSHR